MTPAKLPTLRSMAEAGERPREIARALGAGRATVYRHLDPATPTRDIEAPEVVSGSAHRASSPAPVRDFD